MIKNPRPRPLAVFDGAKLVHSGYVYLGGAIGARRVNKQMVRAYQNAENPTIKVLTGYGVWEVRYLHRINGAWYLRSTPAKV